MPTSTTDEARHSSPDPAEVAARRVGQLFAGKWQIERVIGSGGMATVYAATHTNNQRAVALKVLHAEFSASGDIKKRFLREGFIANRIGHPGAVAILDDGVDDNGNVFLVMELLTGASVADRIRAARKTGDGRRRAFDQVEALRIADGILDVLTAAHAQGIVHRDLKPDNVFVTDVGAVKVLDFGISRLREPQSGDAPEADDGKTNTRTGVLLGTPQYMPPEQARGRSSLIDARSDLWAVGAIVFAMLTSRHVHEAETPNEALLKAMTATAQPLASIAPGVDPKLAAIVDRALAFDQDARYPDARAMQDDVRAAIAVIGPGPLELAPISGLSASGPKPVTAVTRSAVPIVRDTSSGRSGGLRVISVVLFIGVSAFAGRAIMTRFAPQLHASPEDQLGTVDASFPVAKKAGASVVPRPTDGGASSAKGAAAPLVPLVPPVPSIAPSVAPSAEQPTGALALLDAGLDAGDSDAEADDEDDDGGEDEDEVTVEPPSPVAGRGGHVVPGHHPGAAPRKGDPGPHKKKTRKKKKR